MPPWRCLASAAPDRRFPTTRNPVRRNSRASHRGVLGTDSRAPLSSLRSSERVVDAELAGLAWGESTEVGVVGQGGDDFETAAGGEAGEEGAGGRPLGLRPQPPWT